MYPNLFNPTECVKRIFKLCAHINTLFSGFLLSSWNLWFKKIITFFVLVTFPLTNTAEPLLHCRVRHCARQLPGQCQAKMAWKNFSDHVIRTYVYARELSDQRHSRRGYFELGSYNNTKIKWPVLGQGNSQKFWHLLTPFLRFDTLFEFWHLFWFFFNQNFFHQYPYLTLK